MSAEAELERIRAAYRERDAAGVARRGPAVGLHQAELERQVLAALAAAGVDLRRAAVLDVGAGDGFQLQRLAARGAARATGIELMEDRVRRARERFPDLDVRAGSATELPFEDGSFDLVTQFTVLSSVLDPDVRAAIAGEMRRVARPGGVLLSYDLRPSPRVLAAARRRIGGAPADAATPTVALGEQELRRLFGVPERLRSVQLNLDLAELVGARPPVVRALRALPPLRSHLLGTFRA